MHREANLNQPTIAKAMAAVPEGLRAYWEQHGPTEFPGMSVGDKAWAWSLRGLMTYFALDAKSPHQTLLPSRAADSIWHAWLAWDPKSLAVFQRKYFEKVMSHATKEDLASTKPDTNLDAALTRTWALSSELEKIPVLSGVVPFLFTIDLVLNMPTGWLYHHNQQHRRIEVGELSGKFAQMLNFRPVAGLTATAFLGLGLISASEASAWQEEHAKAMKDSGSGSSCGVGISTYSCGSSSGDSGDGGGSSCGGGCGGD